MCISPLTVASPVTSSKPASPTGGLLDHACSLRPKEFPWVNSFKSTPSGKKVFKNNPKWGNLPREKHKFVHGKWEPMLARVAMLWQWRKDDAPSHSQTTWGWIWHEMNGEY